MPADLSPHEAVKLARKMFPDAHRIEARRPVEYASFTTDGKPSITYAPASIDVLRAAPSRTGGSVNNPRGEGATFAGALRALARYCYANKVNDITDMIGESIEDPGLLSFYHVAGPDYSEEPRDA